MAQLITLNNIDPTALTTIGGPKIASIAYSGNDTATAIAGGQTITLTGAGFQSGASVFVDGTVAPVVSVISSTVLSFTAPAKSAGGYALYVVNPDGGTATFPPGIQYSGTPTWVTNSGSLGSVTEANSINISVAATSDSTVAYSVFSGSLPSGLTLDSDTGTISGTAPAPESGSQTTYNFTIRATDAENQDTNRSFSLTVSPIPSPIGQVAYTTAGTYSWTAPAGVKRVNVVAVGGGGGGSGPGGYSTGGGGGGLGWKNAIAVTPGQSYTVVVGVAGAGGPVGVAGGDSYFINASTVKGGGGGVGPYVTAEGGTYTGDGGGNGGTSPYTGGRFVGGGGAGGYSGNGGGGEGNGVGSQSGSGGGAGGGGSGDGSRPAGGGGGVGLLGQGSNGSGAGSSGSGAGGGGGGSGGGNGGGTGYNSASGAGGAYGGGGGGGSPASSGSSGAVRIIWGDSRAFPSTNTADQ